jgi:hypothetical protein
MVQENFLRNNNKIKNLQARQNKITTKAIIKKKKHITQNNFF